MTTDDSPGNGSVEKRVHALNAEDSVKLAGICMRRGPEKYGNFRHASFCYGKAAEEYGLAGMPLASLRCSYLQKRLAQPDQDMDSPRQKGLWLEYLGNYSEAFGDKDSASRYFVDAGDAFKLSGDDRDLDKAAGLFAYARFLRSDDHGPGSE